MLQKTSINWRTKGLSSGGEQRLVKGLVDLGGNSAVVGADAHLANEVVQALQVGLGDQLGHLADEPLLQRSPGLQELTQRNAIGLKAIRKLLDERPETEGPDEGTLTASHLDDAVRLEAAESLADRGLADVEQHRQFGLRGQGVARLQLLVDDERTDRGTRLVGEQRSHWHSSTPWRLFGYPVGYPGDSAMAGFETPLDNAI